MIPTSSAGPQGETLQIPRFTPELARGLQPVYDRRRRGPRSSAVSQCR